MTEELDNFLDYLQKAGLNTINYYSPAWRLLHNHQKIIDKTIVSQNGQKMSIGKLVRHRTVPALGLGLVVGESNQYKGYWLIKWCDQRYSDVGHLGIEESYLEIV